MTAIPLLQDEGGFEQLDPVLEITARIERARARLRHERHARRNAGDPSPAYALFESGALLGAIHAPTGTPVFGPAAPTVYLTRTGERGTR
jgi:hypothetical protein